MEIKSDPFEEKTVIDISARYDNSTVDFTLQEGDTFEERNEFFYAEFNNPNGLKSDIRLYKLGLRAISSHQRKQRYRADLQQAISTSEPTYPPAAVPDSKPGPDPFESSSTQDPGPQA